MTAERASDTRCVAADDRAPPARAPVAPSRASPDAIRDGAHLHGAALVTGATGFMGGHVLEALATAPHVTGVVALARTAGQLPAARLGGAPPVVIEGSLADASAWYARVLPLGVRFVLHLAGAVQHSRAHPEAMIRTNVDGTLAMVELAARLDARLVVASTSGVVACFTSPDRIGYEGDPPCTELIARWPYYMSKLAAEQRALARAKELGVTATMLRLPVMLGPGDARFRSTAHVARLLLGKIPFRLAGGIAFVDVRDAATAAVRALALASPRPIYHVPGTSWTLERFFDAVGEIAGCRAPHRGPSGTACRALARTLETLRAVPGMRGLVETLPDPVLLEMSTRYWGLGSRYAARDLAHVPRDPRTTLAETVDWLRAHHPALRAM